MTTIAGERSSVASRRSSLPYFFLRRFSPRPILAVAASMPLERLEGLLDLLVHLARRLVRRGLALESGVDVVVDRLANLRIDRRHRPRLRLLDGGAQLLREGHRLLDLRVVVDLGDRGRQ